MSKETLQCKKVSELRELAKKLNISKRWDMTKSELVEAIVRAEANGEGIESAKTNGTVDNHTTEAGVESEKEPAGDNAQKMSYVENIEIGALVAFRVPNAENKVKSAKVVRKSTKDRKLRLETDYGAVYTVSFDDIVWVRTGKRWPKGVYRLLKGLTTDEGK